MTPAALHKNSFSNVYLRHKSNYESVSVAGVSDAPGTAHPVDVLVEGEEELLPVNGPDFDALVIRSSEERLSIAGEAHAAHGSRMCSKHCRLPFPDIHRISITLFSIYHIAFVRFLKSCTLAYT